MNEKKNLALDLCGPVLCGKKIVQFAVESDDSLEHVYAAVVYLYLYSIDFSLSLSLSLSGRDNGR
jgi:hypothetical protein